MKKKIALVILTSLLSNTVLSQENVGGDGTEETVQYCIYVGGDGTEKSISVGGDGTEGAISVGGDGTEASISVGGDGTEGSIICELIPVNNI